MSASIAFEPDVQRTIGVDVRYVLFVIDKFAGADWLLDEMTLVKSDCTKACESEGCEEKGDEGFEEKRQESGQEA